MEDKVEPPYGRCDRLPRLRYLNPPFDSAPTEVLTELQFVGRAIKTFTLFRQVSEVRAVERLGHAIRGVLVTGV